MRKHLTYANVMATFAVAFALGGGVAYAANTVFSTDIVDGEVKTADLDNNAVRTTKIVNGQVANADLHADAVDSSKVVNGSIGNADLGVDSVQAIQIADDTIDGGEIIDNSMQRSWARSRHGLAENAVGNSELGDDAVGSANVISNSLTTADIAGTDASGAISLGSGSVGNGRCDSFNISVPGAVAGQGVIISAKAALQTGVTIYGQSVLSADTASMVVCNLSGTTMNALSSFPIRTITFG